MKSARGKGPPLAIGACTYFIVCVGLTGTEHALLNDQTTDSLPARLSLSGNLEAEHRTTNFYKSDQNATLLQGDARLEIWLPQAIRRFSWGPYIRIAGLDSNRPEAWENAWMAGPGFGIYMFPFSDEQLRKQAGFLGPILGPLRLFGEHNRLNYVGAPNVCHTDEQVRAGADFWRAHHVNDTNNPWWAKLCLGLFWQSANEFDRHLA